MKNSTKFFSIFIAIGLIIWSLPGIAQVTPQYTNGTPFPNSGNSIPLAWSTGGVRGQLLYPAGCFGSNVPSGMGITDIYWMAYNGSSGSSTYGQLHISMGQPNITTLSGSAYETGLTQVFSTTSYTITYTGGNWFKITLNQPFPYDPTLPLVVEVNQLQSSFSNFYCAILSPYPTGSARNYANSYNATSPSGSSSPWSNAFGVDLAPISNAKNDIGVTAIDSPSVFCDGDHNVVVTVKNFGKNQVDTFDVNWTFNGTLQQAVTVHTLLDTFNGVGSTEAQVVLGTKTFTANQLDTIVAWTSNPNNQTDTVTSNDSTGAGKMPSMYGNFTIDPNGTGTANYTNFSDLAKDLSDFGVCGPVTVTVANGTYTEQVTFDNIEGTSMVNTITFLPDSGYVDLEYNSGSFSMNYTMKMAGASHISFQDFNFHALGSSYSRVVEFGGNSNYNSFNSCTFNGYANGTSSTYQALIYAQGKCDGNSFMDCDFDAGSYGFYYRGGGTTSRSTGLTVENCNFNDQYYRGAYFYYTSDLHFNHNVIRSSRNYSFYYAVYSYYSNGDFQMVGNDINVPGYSPIFMGYTEGDNTNRPLLANNFIRVGKGTGLYGYGIYCFNAGYMRIVNNTVVCTHSTGTYRAIYITGGANTIMNNNIHDQNGYSTSSSYACLYVNGGFAVLECDYNNFYTNRTLGYLSGAYATLSDWQNATGFDMNSLTTDPLFVNFDSLRTCSDTLDGAGTPLAYITDDFDGDGRHPVTPDIGADEWVGSDSGAYSAGPDAFVCDGKTAMIGLEVSGGSFLWSSGDTTSTIEVSTEGTYTVAMTSDCGASHTDTVEVVDITPTATFDLTPSDNTFLTIDADNTSNHGDSYMWTIEDQNGVNATDTLYSMDLTHIVMDNGPYEVCLTTYNDCDTASSCQTWTGVVGIDKADLSSNISLMPNPVSDVLTIQFEGIEGDVTVEMSNVQGQVVHMDRYMNVAGNAVQEVNVSSLKKGMYIVKFVTETGIATKQIIVQ